MEKYDGASALHFLSHNYEGHEIIAVTMWGNPKIQHDVVQDMGEYEPCVYHIDIYYEKTFDIDDAMEVIEKVIEYQSTEAYQNEYQKFVEALSQWTNYDDEAGVAGQGGDE
jgi:hypothetical protein